MREAATWLTLNADPESADALRAVGERLVARAQELEGTGEPEDDTQPPGGSEGSAPSFPTLVEGWASALDRSRYTAYAHGDQVYVQSAPPKEVEEALREGNEDLQRGNEVLRIQWKYFAGGARGRAKTPPPVGDELAQDLATAEGLVADPPATSAVSIVQMAAAVAAHAVKVVVLRWETLPNDAQTFRRERAARNRRAVRARQPTTTTTENSLSRERIASSRGRYPASLPKPYSFARSSRVDGSARRSAHRRCGIPPRPRRSH